MSHSTTTPSAPASMVQTFDSGSRGFSAGLTSADWVTRDDMAALTRKSADTITRDLKRHAFESREDEAGRVLVNVGDFLQIGRLRPEDLTAGNTPAESAEVIRARQSITELKERAAELTGRLGHSDTLVEALREQLAVKDKQLAKQADQITQLIARLGTFSTPGALAAVASVGAMGGAA